MQPTPASLVASKPLTLKFEINILKLKLGKEAAKCHRRPEARKISCIIKINLCVKSIQIWKQICTGGRLYHQILIIWLVMHIFVQNAFWKAYSRIWNCRYCLIPLVVVLCFIIEVAAIKKNTHLPCFYLRLATKYARVQILDSGLLEAIKTTWYCKRFCIFNSLLWSSLKNGFTCWLATSSSGIVFDWFWVYKKWYMYLM